MAKWRKQVRADVRDARKLGWGFGLRNLARLSGARVATVPLKGVGPIHLRWDDSDADAFRQVFARREYDLAGVPQGRRLVETYQRLLSEGRRPVIVDAGANVGAASLWFARLFPQALVCAVEPDPANAEFCRRNTAPRDNIRVFEGAIGARPGQVRLVSSDTQSWGIRTERAEGEGVRVYTVDEVLASAGPDAAMLIVKVDIEGFEADLFAENTGWIDRAEAVMVEPHDWMLPGQRASRSLQKAMFGREFEMLVRGESLIFVREAQAAAAAEAA